MTIKEELTLVCKTKESVVKLSSENLKKYKIDSYSQPFQKWQLDLLREYIWGDISFEEIKKIFKLK